MKYYFTLCFLLIISLLTGQSRILEHDRVPGNILSYKPAFDEAFPEWAKMLYSDDLNYFELLNSYDNYMTSSKGSYKAIERYFKIWKRQVEPFIDEKGELKNDLIEKQYRLLHELQTKGSHSFPSKNNSENEWNFVGPKETYWLNESGSFQDPASCSWQVNIYSFDIAKSNDSVIYCGTETGFVNKTLNKGLSWNLMGKDYIFGGGITSVAVDPDNEDIVYVAAGRQIHLSEDGGSNWRPMLDPNQSFHADKISIDPNDTSRLMAAGSSGVFLSTDAGDSWSRVWTDQAFDVHYKTDDSNVVTAIASNGTYFRMIISRDGGESFDIMSGFPSQIRDVSGALSAVTEASPESIYLILLEDVPLIYKGNVDTDEWQLLARGETSALALNNGQGFFDLILEVSPTNPNLIFAGTSSLYKSTSGGASFSIIGGYGGDFPIHPDIQCMKILGNGEAWVSTDGGLSYSTDNFSVPQNTVARNNLMIGSDFWGFDQAWNEDIAVGGRYHNGNTAISDLYGDKALRMGGAESPTGWIMKGKSKHVVFNDLGAGWILPETAESRPQGRFVFSKYPNMDEYGGRRGNLLIHPNYYEIIYLGEGTGFWKSMDMGTSFELIYDFGERVRYCQISFADPDIIYADVVNKGLYRSDDGGYTWRLLSSLTDGTNGSFYWAGKMHFDISPVDANTIYVCLQSGTWNSDIGKIFKSQDGGESWEDLTGNLNAVTKELLIQPDEQGNDIIYLITQAYNNVPSLCYILRPESNAWEIYGSDYPAGFRLNHALTFFRDSKLRVAGNAGVWECELDVPDHAVLLNAWAGRPLYNCSLDTIQLEDHSIVNHENCEWTWSIDPEPVYIEDRNIRNPRLVLGEAGTYDVSLSIVKDGVSYSKTFEDLISATDCPSLENCDNPDLIPKDLWQLVYVDSEELNYPGYASMAFDNDPQTIWHTRWSTGSDPYPHEIQIDMGELYDVYEFTYYPRQNGQNGWIKDYELYFTEDLNDWGEPSSKGAFEKSGSPHKVVLDSAVTARYFKLLALSEVNGNAWSSASEFEVKGCYNYKLPSRDVTIAQELNVFPVPSNGRYSIELPNRGYFEYRLFSISGQLIEKKDVLEPSDRLEIDISGQADGIYVLSIRDNQNRRFIVKLIKE